MGGGGRDAARRGWLFVTARRRPTISSRNDDAVFVAREGRARRIDALRDDDALAVERIAPVLRSDPTASRTAALCVVAGIPAAARDDVALADLVAEPLRSNGQPPRPPPLARPTSTTTASFSSTSSWRWSSRSRPSRRSSGTCTATSAPSRRVRSSFVTAPSEEESRRRGASGSAVGRRRRRLDQPHSTRLDPRCPRGATGTPSNGGSVVTHALLAASRFPSDVCPARRRRWPATGRAARADAPRFPSRPFRFEIRGDCCWGGGSLSLVSFGLV